MDSRLGDKFSVVIMPQQQPFSNLSSAHPFPATSFSKTKSPFTTAGVGLCRQAAATTELTTHADRQTTDGRRTICLFILVVVHPTDRRPDLNVVKDKHILLAAREKPFEQVFSIVNMPRSLSQRLIVLQHLPAPDLFASGTAFFCICSDGQMLDGIYKRIFLSFWAWLACELDQQKLTNKINLFRRRIASKSGLGTFVSGPVGWLVSFATNCLSLAACSWLVGWQWSVDQRDISVLTIMMMMVVVVVVVIQRLCRPPKCRSTNEQYNSSF
ncbi:Adenylyltransferase and sulfurtransferase UBA4 [Trichinella pseudospiralis]